MSVVILAITFLHKYHSLIFLISLSRFCNRFLNHSHGFGRGCGGGSCCVESQGVVFGLWDFAIRYVMCREEILCLLHFASLVTGVLFNYKGFLEWWFPLSCYEDDWSLGYLKSELGGWQWRHRLKDCSMVVHNEAPILWKGEGIWYGWCTIVI